MRTVNDPYGGNAGLVDKLIGTAFDVVRAVQRELPAIKYVAGNMQAIVALASAQPEKYLMVGGSTGSLGSTVELDLPATVTPANIRSISVMIVTATGDVYGDASGLFAAAIVNGFVRVTLFTMAPVAMANAEIRCRLSYES